MSFACAGALAFADKEQFNSSWFSGINNATAIDALGAQNGVWNLTVDSNASVNKDGALELDLDADEEATFKVADTASAKAAGTLPAQGIVVRGVFTPIAEEDLLKGKAMAEKHAKVGFAIVNVGTDTYKYYAWVGGGSEAETESASETESTSAIGDWVCLGNATAVTTAKTIVIDLEYESESVTAAFAVGAGNLENLEEATPLTKDNGDDCLPLEGSALSKALADKVIASVSCMGSGTLNELKGLYQYAVAEVNGTLYGTVEDAVVAARQTGATVTLVREAEGSVTVAGVVTIDPNGKGAPTVTVDAEQDNSKEAVTDEKTHIVTVQTKTAILQGVTVGTAGKGLMANQAGFRAFLNQHCKVAYTQANTTANAIKTALETPNETSGRKLWQSYALGVEPDAAVTPQQVAQDTDADNITLALPVNPTGDFTVKCAVGNETPQTLTGQAPTFKVPMTTGRYQVKVSFE